MRALALIMLVGCGRIAFDEHVDLPLPSEFRVASFGHHNCALRPDDGALYCWGRNLAGVLGTGDITDRPPTRVPGEWVDFYLGEWNTCARDRRGELWCWGRNELGTLGDGGGFNVLVPARSPLVMDSLLFGEAHGCGLVDGSVYCWGSQSCGRVVPGLDDASIALPVQVAGLPAITALAVHDTQSCGLGVDRRVYCWGTWNAGGGGMYSPCGAAFATPIEALAIPQPVVELRGGCHGHVCARTEAGALYCWGANGSGQIGIDNINTALSPQLVSTLPPATGFAVGAFTTCATTASGFYCWGDNRNGAFGNGVMSTTDTLAPLHVAALDGKRIESLALGCFHACATIDEQLSCWGANGYMAVGDGLTTDRPSPTPITLP